jgi:hypothetical protein
MDYRMCQIVPNLSTILSGTLLSVPIFRDTALPAAIPEDYVRKHEALIAIQHMFRPADIKTNNRTHIGPFAFRRFVSSS